MKISIYLSGELKRQPRICKKPSKRTRVIVCSVYELGICTRVLQEDLSSRRLLNVYVNQMHSKELTERCNKTLKYRKEVCEAEPHSTIKLEYPVVLRSRTQLAFTYFNSVLITVEKSMKYIQS